MNDPELDDDGDLEITEGELRRAMRVAFNKGRRKGEAETTAKFDRLLARIRALNYLPHRADRPDCEPKGNDAHDRNHAH